MKLELVVRCTLCGEFVDRWDLADGDGDDLATHVCEIASDLNFDHVCAASKPLLEEEQ